MPVTIEDALGQLDEVRRLFAEYTAGIIEQDARTAEVLSAQGYDGELEAPDGKYGPPGGRLYIARLEDGFAAGCAALHGLGNGGCELKRLYVRDSCRGRGIATALMSRAVEDARKLGYGHMLLDTLPFMRDAIALYVRFGFVPTERYNDSPSPETIYMRLDL